MPRRPSPTLCALLFAVAACSPSASQSPAQSPPLILPVTPPSASVAAEGDGGAGVNRSGNAATRLSAVNDSIQRFEDAKLRDRGDNSRPHVKALLDTIIAPLNESCVAPELEPETRSRLIRFLSDAQDPRAEGCFVKALGDYQVDVTEEDVRWASRAVGALRLRAGSAALFAVFEKVDASKPKGGSVYRDIHDAMLALADPAWEDGLINHLDHPIADRKDARILKAEAFWQITAAELLANAKSVKAIRPLIKEVLSPFKADIASTAVLSLVKIGKPAMAPLVALLESQDADLVSYSKTENLRLAQGADGKVTAEGAKAAARAHIEAAAIILGTMGRGDASKALVDAIAAVPDDASKVMIARNLDTLPKTPELVRALQRTYERAPVSLTIPPGNGAKEALLDTVVWLFDPAMVPWLVKTSKALTGAPVEVDGIRAAALSVAMKLMTKDQIGDVEAFNAMRAKGADGTPSTLGKGWEREWAMSKSLVTTCGDRVDCYLAKVAEPASQTPDALFVGIKAAYMIGVYGNANVRTKLVDAMPHLTNAAIRFVAGRVIDYFSPNGDVDIAQRLQAIVDEGVAAKDYDKIAANAPFKTIIARLNARAQ